ncbi:MAG: YicC/YloC family endoribonuclease, partial [Phycisphaerae bacterium]
MIQSMTGYGSAQHADQGFSYALEIRSVNNRYLKLSTKLPEHLQFLEPAVEKVIRTRLGRGSITLHLRARTEVGVAPRPINVPVLQSYVDQVAGVKLPPNVSATLDLGTLASMPGVCDMPDYDEQERQQQLDVVTSLANRGLDTMIAMRQQEG